MNKTGIEYLTHTWNPIAMRCTRVSPGCDNCWHLKMANRHAGNYTIRSEIREARAGGGFALLEDELAAPLKARKPATIGVQFMGDLFHESIPFEWIAQVYFTMVGEASAEPSPAHTYLLLTKRPKRMAEFYEWLRAQRNHDEAWLDSLGIWALMNDATHPRVWLGVSVEDQASADDRVQTLLALNAAVTFVSYEPALGIVDWRSYLSRPITGIHSPGVDWLIAGSETGAGKRPADLDWFRQARDQCAAVGVPYFFKKQTDGRRELDGILHEAMPCAR